MELKLFIYVLLGLPLLGLFLNVLFYPKISDRLSGWIATLSVIVSALISWIIFLFNPSSLNWELYAWMDTSLLDVSVGFLIDPLSTIMLVIVTTVGACVHLYSIEYMEQDAGIRRFFIYLNLFLFSMLILITANNLLMMFIGWEGVGLCSYLLIGFWYEEENPRWAGQKAFVVNRLGDLSFLIGLFLLYSVAGTFEFESLPKLVDGMSNQVLTGVGLLLFGGAVGKSAQFPLYVWLPDAMEGPTPVSSLIHAATMVTAGVYLIARMGFLYSLIIPVGYFIAFVGAFTALFAATVALVKTDMKRILAFSTISQLGYMISAVGLGAYGAGIFHLVTHAFFKGLLFLMAGSVMHALHGELNIFKMDHLADDMPLTSSMAVIGGLGLAGVPPLSGFFSKDEILLATLEHSSVLNWTLFIILSFSALLTSFYTFRMIFEAFWSSKSADSESVDGVHECGWKMGIPMILLAIGTILGSYFGGWTAELSHDAAHHGPHLLVGITSILASFGGLILAYLFYFRGLFDPDNLFQKGKFFGNLLQNQYYVEDIYQNIIQRPLRRSAKLFWKYFDDLIVDGLINLMAVIVDIGGLMIRFVQTGYMRHYLLLLGFFVTLVLWMYGIMVMGL